MKYTFFPSYRFIPFKKDYKTIKTINIKLLGPTLKFGLKMYQKASNLFELSQNTLKKLLFVS